MEYPVACTVNQLNNLDKIQRHTFGEKKHSWKELFSIPRLS